MPQRNRRLAAAIAADDRRQYEIAGISAVNPNTLSAITAGRQQPTPEQARRLAETLGLTVADLFDLATVDQ